MAHIAFTFWQMVPHLAAVLSGGGAEWGEALADLDAINAPMSQKRDMGHPAGKKGYMAMFTAYFDASGHPAGTDVLSVAGFVAHASQWTLFEKRWQKVLNRYGVSSLHMKDFAHSTGEYKAWKGDEKKRVAFLSSLIGVIKQTARHSFASSLYLPAYRTIDNAHQIRAIRSPLAFAGCTVLQNARNWALETRIDLSQMLFVFEDGDADKPNFFQSAVHDVGITPNFMPKSQTNAFQAADLLAYEHLKANLKVVPQSGVYEMEDLRKPFQALYEIPNGEGGKDWSIIEQSELEQTIKELWPRLGLTWS
jgi:hypothetical protein